MARHLRTLARLLPSRLQVGAALLGLSILTAAGLLLQRSISEDWVRHTTQVQARLSTARIINLRGEIAIRAYFLNGDPRSLARYRTQIATARRELDALQLLIVDNPQQGRNLENLEKTIVRHAKEIEALVALPDAQRKSAVLRWLAANDGRDATGGVRAAMERVSGEEARLLRERERRADQFEAWGIGVLLISITVVLGLALAVWRDRRDQERALRVATLEREADLSRRLEAERQLKLLADNATDAVFRLNLQGRFTYASPSTKVVFGVEPETVVGHHLALGMFDEDRPALLDALDKMSKGLSDRAIVTYRTARPDGDEPRWVEASVALLRNAEAEPMEIIASVRDITVRMRLKEELQQACQRAEDAAAVKAAFLANMSHEIRTPMNGVLGFADLMLSGDLTPEQHAQVQIIADSGRAMMRLLNDILDLSKIDAGQMQVVPEPFDPRHALQACARLMNPAVAQKRLELDVDLADIPAKICADGLRLRQIVLNLLGNAAKFTSEGTIKLTARTQASGPDGPALIVSVADTGIGIPAERQQAIFEAFAQADSSIAGRFGGTGLGLSISARLAQLMNGSLSVRSEPGKGSCFTLTLPYSPVQECEWVQFDTGPSAPAEVRDASPPRVLVAEDHDVNQTLMISMLSRLGCQPMIASDGCEAFDLVVEAAEEGRPYDLVLMDMQMPVCDGVESTRRIRAAGIGADRLPIVALTANAYADDIAASLEAGMQAHIAKPIDLAKLEQALRQWTKGAIRSARSGDAGSGQGPLGLGVRAFYLANKQEMLEAVEALVRHGEFSDAELSEVAGLLHKIAGTAGMFGEAALGDEARAFEEGLKRWPSGERRDRVVEAAESLRNAA